MLRSLVLTTAMTSMLPGAAHAVSISYPDFTDTSELTFNDNGGAQSATVVNGSLQLTENGGGSGVTSVWVTDPVQLAPGNAFEAWFSFSVLGEGDGLSFALQDQGNTALGGGGSSMGINGISPYVAVLIDSFGSHNEDIRLTTTGDAELASADVDRGIYQDSNADGSGEIGYAWVEYDGTTLEVYFSGTNVKPDSSVISHEVDLVSLLGDDPVFVGFTAATGGADATHQIHAFEFTSVPEPASLALLVTGVGLMAVRRRR